MSDRRLFRSISAYLLSGIAGLWLFAGFMLGQGERFDGATAAVAAAIVTCWVWRELTRGKTK